MSCKSKRIFVCPMVPDSILSKYRLSVAANNFCRRLTHGNIFDAIYTYLTPNVTSLNGVKDDEKQGNTIFFFGFLRGNRLLRKFAFIAENIAMFRRIKSYDTVWFYNMPYTVLILFILLRLLKPKCALNLILLDYTPNQKGLRRIYNWFEVFCYNHYDGIIVLSPFRELTQVNQCCLPGVVSLEDPSWPKIDNVIKEFLISGALNDNIAMLSTLLDAFAALPDFKLHITGNAPDPALIKLYTDRFSNIIYHGMVDYDKYQQILHNTPFLLSTRNPRAAENQCNFPSKIIEALLHNRIIISTIHYPQIEGIKYFEIGSDAKSMYHDLLYIASLSHDELMSYANQSEIVKSRYNTDVWRRCMEKIENLK